MRSHLIRLSFTVLALGGLHCGSETGPNGGGGGDTSGGGAVPSLSTTHVDMKEGESTTLQLLWSASLAKTVPITVNSTNPALLEVLPANLEGLAGSNVTNVTLKALADDNKTNDHVDLVFKAGTTELQLSVDILDNDRATLVLGPEEIQTLTEGGDPVVFKAFVASEIASTVAVDITIEGNPLVTTEPEVIRFGPENWDKPQTITVSAKADNDAKAVDATLVLTPRDANMVGARTTIKVVDPSDTTPRQELLFSVTKIPADGEHFYVGDSVNVTLSTKLELTGDETIKVLCVDPTPEHQEFLWAIGSFPVATGELSKDNPTFELQVTAKKAPEAVMTTEMICESQPVDTYRVSIPVKISPKE